MEKIKTSNMWQTTVNGFVSLLSEAYVNIYNTYGLHMNKFPSVMLWGAPGVGKSQGVQQIARNIQKDTGKMVYVTDVRLLLFNPIDLRGIPVADQNKEFAIWLKPKIFEMKKEDCINILFLDEISAAPQSVQAAAYQITLDRKVGEHLLPDNCIVIAAGNRITDKSVAVKMPRALSNRMLHVEVSSNPKIWLRWATENNISSKVVGFLQENGSKLCINDSNNDDLAFPTPRTWEMVSNVLKIFNDDHIKAYPLIAGLIGKGLALEFKSWCSVYAELPKMEDIFNGTAMIVPKKTDELYALITSITEEAKQHKDDTIKIGNSIRYAMKLPADYAELLMQNYSLLGQDFNDFLKEVPEYRNYLYKKGQLLNGKI